MHTKNSKEYCPALALYPSSYGQCQFAPDLHRLLDLLAQGLGDVRGVAGQADLGRSHCPLLRYCCAYVTNFVVQGVLLELDYERRHLYRWGMFVGGL
jgi:hypothetical protein